MITQEIECSACGKKFFKQQKYINQARKLGYRMCCSRECTHDLQRTAIDVECTNCGKKFTRQPSQLSKRGHNFCSSSCSAQYTNRVAPKKEAKPRYCKRCGTKIPTGMTRTYCDNCQPGAILSRTTLGEIRKTSKNFHTRIRDNAQHIYNKSDKPHRCTVCGFDRFYEICHIKAIKDFDDEATVAEINHIDNLTALCPNCHWIHDHPDC